VTAAAVAGSGVPVVARAAVLGSPIAHSLSPVLHRAGYRELGLTGWSYEAIECGEPDLAGFLDSLAPDWAGLSLTMPLKRAVLPLLAETEQLALDVGAANTVLLRDGRRHGFNTDVPGMVTALRAGGVSSGEDALILGGGATASAALAALRELGAQQVTVAIRSVARAEPLRAVAARLGLDVRVLELGDWFGGEVGAQRGGADTEPFAAVRRLLISTIPAAGAAAAAGHIASGAIRADVVFDVGYDPWPTAVAEAAVAVGVRVISGYELLLSQAIGQFELMTGKLAPVAAMRAAGLAELDRRRNNRRDLKA
jgi:shikimate dehydrogenase